MVREILAEAARPTNEEAWAALDRIAKAGKPSPVCSGEIIRASGMAMTQIVDANVSVKWRAEAAGSCAARKARML